MTVKHILNIPFGCLCKIFKPRNDQAIYKPRRTRGRGVEKATCCCISAFVSLPTVEHTMLQGAIKKELENSRLKKNSQIKHLF